MKTIKEVFIPLMVVVTYWQSLSFVHAEDSPCAAASAQAQTQAQARPEIEKQRKEAEQEAKKTLDNEAIAAIRETQNAVKAIASGKTDEALATIEKATGKINVLTARNPATALLPVDLVVEAIDVAPLDKKAIRQTVKAAERAIDDKDYPAARVLLGGLISEIRIRTHHLPLATYPDAMKEAARLLDQKKTQEAKLILLTALNTLVIIDRVIPLPIAVAQTAIDAAQAKRDTNKDEAQKLLAMAESELERARELGYAGMDPEYDSLNKSIADLQKQLKGNENTASAFSRLKEKVASFFKRQSQSEKKSELASR